MKAVLLCVVVVLALRAAAICPIYGNTTYKLLDDSFLSPNPYQGYAQDSKSKGSLKCQLNSNCYLLYPVRLLVPVNLGDVASPQTCGAAIGFTPPQTVNTLPAGLDELAKISAAMRFVSMDVIKAEVVLFDVANSVVVNHLKEFTYAPSKPFADSVRALYNGPGNPGFTWAALGPVVGFKLSDYPVYSYRTERFMMSFSIVAKYAPIITSTFSNATEQQCREFPEELIPQCDRPGYLDINYADPIREFIDFNLPPMPAFVGLGQVTANGSSPTTAVPDAVAWRVPDDIRTYGRCTSKAQCGFVNPFCFANLCGACSPLNLSACADLNQGAVTPASCTTEPRKSQYYCDFLAMQSPPPPQVTRPSDQVCACNAQFCIANACVTCRTGMDSDCELPWTPDSQFTAKCTGNKCNYSVKMPSLFKVKDDRKKVAIIAGCVAAGVVLIAACVVGVVCYFKRAKSIQAGNLMGDQLAKTKKEKRFTFSD